jgi:mannan endo-1,4-beta-mannosidase
MHFDSKFSLLHLVLIVFPLNLMAQVTGFVEDFNDNVLIGWVLEAEHDRTYTLTEADSMLRIDYHRVAESWEWDNFNFTPPLIDASQKPYITVDVISNVNTVLTFKPVYENETDDWIHVDLPDDSVWHTYTFALMEASNGSMVRIYMYLDGGSTTPVSGTVYFDDLRIADSVTVYIPPDFSELQEAISNAQLLYNTSLEGTEEGQFLPGSKAELDAAIITAQSVYNAAEPTQHEVDQAVWDLYDACVTFETRAKVENIYIIDSLATKQTKYLFQNLLILSGRHLMFGMHDVTGYGVGWSGDNDRSDVKSVCGDYPAVYCWDANRIPAQNDLPGYEYRVTSAFNRGGINSICWHQIDPEGRGFYASDVDNERIVETLLPGGEYHEFYKLKLYKLAKFMKSLRGSYGQSIPVIFRPYHEHDGGWFWWGAGHCTPQEYSAIWQFTVTYLRDSLNVHNLLYAISPGIFQSKESYLSIYPGDDYVDIIGMDHYFGPSVSFNDRQNFLDRLRVAVELAEEKDKVAALTETGQEAIPLNNWFTGVLLDPLKNDLMAANVAYAAVWRNANTSHHYAPYPGHPSVPDFLKFYDDAYTLFEDDLNAIYEFNSESILPPYFYDVPEKDLTFYDTTVTIQATTNKRAYVRYSNSDEIYDNMPNEFEQGQGSTRHLGSVRGLHGQDNIYYVRASDNLGNAMDTSLTVSFYVDTTIKPVDWNDPLYVTTEWQIGKAPLGYGNTADSTEIEVVNAAYFRHEFTVSNVDSVTFLTAFILCHDGAVLYLNGERVASINMPVSGAISYDTKALDASQTIETFSLDKSRLKNGKNMLAVEVHQSETSNPNISFDLKLFTSMAVVIPRKSDWYYYDQGNEPQGQLLGLGQQQTQHTILEKFHLYQNYPNPFNSETIIRFQLRMASHIKLEIYDVLGRKIKTLVDGSKNAGLYMITWNGRNERGKMVASGLYIYRLETGDRRVSKKLTFLK